MDKAKSGKIAGAKTPRNLQSGEVQRVWGKQQCASPEHFGRRGEGRRSESGGHWGSGDRCAMWVKGLEQLEKQDSRDILWGDQATWHCLGSTQERRGGGRRRSASSEHWGRGGKGAIGAAGVYHGEMESELVVGKTMVADGEEWQEHWSLNCRNPEKWRTVGARDGGGIVESRM
ncbi:unnamed protein product [Calypogeia fissa]